MEGSVWRAESQEGGYTENKTRTKPGAKKQLVIMLISVILMLFSVTQVYYLAKYTFGHFVPEEKMKVYKWVYMLLEGTTTKK